MEPWTIVHPTDSTRTGGGKERPAGDMVARAQMKMVTKNAAVRVDVSVRSLLSLWGWIQINGSEIMLKMM